MKYRQVLDSVQPHVAFAAFIPLIAAAVGALSDQMSGAAGRRAQRSSDLTNLQRSQSGKAQFEPSADQARVLPELPQGTSLNQALGYDEARRTGQPGASETSFSEEPNMSFEARDYSGGAQLGGSMPPPQAGAYSVAGTQPSASYDMSTVPSQGNGLSGDQYVQLGKLGLQAAQMFSGSGRQSPMPQPAPAQPYQTVASRTRRL